MPRKKLANTAESSTKPTSVPAPEAPTPSSRRRKKAQAPAVEVAQIAETISEPSAVVQAVKPEVAETPIPSAVVPKGRRRKGTAETAPVAVEPISEPPAVVPAVAPQAIETPAAKPTSGRTRRTAQKTVEPPVPAPEPLVEEVALEPAPATSVFPEATLPETTSPETAEAVTEAPAPAKPANRKLFGKQTTAKEVTEKAAPQEVVEKAAPKKATGGRSKKATPPEPEVVASEIPVAPEPVVEEERPEGFDYATFDLPIPIWRPRASTTPAVTGAVAETDSEEAEASTDQDSNDRDGNDRRRRRRRRGRGGDDRAPATTPEPMSQAAAPTEEDESSETAEESPAAPAPAVEAPREGSNRDRRRPGREGKGNRPEPAATPNPAPAMATPPVEERPTTSQRPLTDPAPSIRRDRVPPRAPEKAAIAIPEEAPQVVVRDGVPTLVRNHRVIPPIMFFGSPSDEKRAETVMEEVRMAAEAGVHLHSYLVEFEVDPDTVDDAVAVAAYVLSRSVQVDPESQVVFRVVFQAPRGWEQKYPNAKYRHADGSTAEPSVCDDEFWNVARTCLERFVRKMRMLDLKDHILGLHLERGEWFFGEGLGYDDSKAAKYKFRDWARLRYLNDEVTLRASWFDGQARFDSIEVPEYRPEGDEGDRFIRSSRHQRRYVDYHLFLSDATVQRIADLAYTAKEASEGMFLIGASYGYTFEWSHPASGHLSLGKLLRTPEIDFIAGPPSYRSRQPGGSAAFPGPIDSFALNGKLYISEEDFKTSLSIGHEPDDFNPQLKTPQALESVHWRGVGASLAHASGVAWMDLWGNGWLRTNSVWERARKVREAMIDRLGTPLDDPDVAVFIDERALAYLVDDHAFKLLVQNVRESVLRAGVSAAFYLLSDLAHREKFPESKLYLFVNAWDIRPELRAAIKSRLQRDNKVLFWLYSAGLFDAGRESLERAREVTGIALKPQPFYSKSGTTILNRRHPLSEAFPDRNLVGGTKLEPSYFAIPEGATVLGEYTQTGLPSFVVKEFKDGPAESHWTSVFLGEPQVNPALIRALAQMAGAHVWNFQEDVVHVRHPFCTVHCQGAGPRTLTLPGKYSAYNLLKDEWSAVDSSHLRFTAVEGSTYCFLVGARHELEQQLNADAGKLLYIEKLPPRESNVRVDSSNFDVPIMKLDEWMVGNDSDDNADEWFLRPQPVEEEPISQAQAEESPERVGRRRRRRGGRERNGQERTGNGSSREAEAPRFESVGSDSFPDLDLNVMFRKRE